MATDARNRAADAVRDDVTGTPLATDATTSPERTLGQLVASATKDVQTIVRNEIDLAKAEISTSAKNAGVGAGMLVGAAVVALYGLGFLLTALAWGLAQLGLWNWLAFLIVAVLLLVVAGVLALVGKKSMSRVKPVPERTIANAEATIAAIKQQR